MNVTDGAQHVGWPHLVDVTQPFADVFEALGVGDVVDQHDAHGSSVVGCGDGVEPFLARCVPANKTILNLEAPPT